MIYIGAAYLWKEMLNEAGKKKDNYIKKSL
jgi:hypothetical protein